MLKHGSITDTSSLVRLWIPPLEFSHDCGGALVLYMMRDGTENWPPGKYHRGASRPPTDLQPWKRTKTCWETSRAGAGRPSSQNDRTSCNSIVRFPRKRFFISWREKISTTISAKFIFAVTYFVSFLRNCTEIFWRNERKRNPISTHTHSHQTQLAHHTHP
jgi:hypothetical protein